MRAGGRHAAARLQPHNGAPIEPKFGAVNGIRITLLEAILLLLLFFCSVLFCFVACLFVDACPQRWPLESTKCRLLAAELSASLAATRWLCVSAPRAPHAAKTARKGQPSYHLGDD